jgi:chemotaxis protein CheX
MVTEPPTFTVVQLSAALDCKEAGLLAARLRTLRRQPVKLDASRVNRLSGLCLQVLLSARNTWESDNVPIVLEEASAVFSKGWSLYGAAPFAS